MSKKSFELSVIANEGLDKVWETLFIRFGSISNFNPNVEGSHFVSGSAGEVGCERVCNFDSKSFVRERIVKVESLKSFSVDIMDGNMPMLDEMRVTFELNPITNKQTKIDFFAEYKTKPAFMGSLIKIMFKKKLADTLIGLKYHLETGENVSKKTFKSVYKRYQKLQLNQSFN